MLEGSWYLQQCTSWSGYHSNPKVCASFNSLCCLM